MVATDFVEFVEVIKEGEMARETNGLTREFFSEAEADEAAANANASDITGNGSAANVTRRPPDRDPAR